MSQGRCFTRIFAAILSAFIMWLAAWIAVPGKAYCLSAQTLDLTILSDSSIRLTWTSYLRSSHYYRVERKTDNGSFVLIDRIYQSDSQYGKKINYTDDEDLSAGHIYTYRIVSVEKSSGTREIYSEEVSASLEDTTAPVSLKATPVSSEQIDLEWSYPGSKGYRTCIERREDTAGAWEEIAIVPAGTTVYSDTDLLPNTKYYYRVKAVYSAHVYSKPYPGTSAGRSVYTLFDAPAGLYGYAISPTRIRLEWNDTDGETAYIIERKQAGFGDFEEVARVAKNKTAWTDQNLERGSLYIYRIKAVTANTTSDYSEELSVACVYLQPPSNLKATGFNNSQIRLEWIDNSSDETGFVIWRREGRYGNWEKYYTTTRDVTCFIDSDVLPDVRYYYRVNAVEAYYKAHSGFSNEVHARSDALEAPTGLKYTVLSKSRIQLEWKDNSNSEDSYRVERKTGMSGEWETVAVLPANATKYTDTGLNSNEYYFYRIMAIDDSLNSASLSSEILVSSGVPAPPEDLEAMALSPSQVKLRWKDTANNEEGFIIQRKQGPYGFYSEIARTSPDTVTFTDNYLMAGVEYYYRVRAYNKAGNSGYSNEAFALTGKTASFSDVPYTHWARREIESLAGMGAFWIENGGVLNPDKEITRAEFTYMAIKALKLDAIGVGSFKDVTPEHPFYREIMVAKKVGIVNGDWDNCFHPDQPLKREDMAVIVIRALKAAGRMLPAPDVSILYMYKDVESVSAYAQGSLASLIGAGVMTNLASGADRNLLNPAKGVTRAEASVVLYNAINATF